MSCHFSCATCTLTTFTSCITCPTSSTFSNGACFCTYAWSSSCTGTTSLQPFYNALKIFYLVLILAVMFLHYLKVRLPYSYRIIAGMQGFGLLIFTNQIYLYYENEFGLSILATSNGFYYFRTRLDSFQINYGMAPIALFVYFIFIYFSMYFPSKTFVKTYESYKQYLYQNVWNFLYTFYYFTCRNMFFFIGMWINSMSTNLSLIIPFILFAIIILVVLIKFIYDYHKNQFEQNCIYQPELYLYAMLSGVPMVGLPFVHNPLYYIVIYVVQIGILILLAILNRNYQVITKPKVLFYSVEVIISGLIIAFIMVGDPYRAFILLATICLATLVMVVQLSVVYYSGVSLARSSKIHPENAESQPINDSNQDQANPRKNTKASTAKNNYF